MITPEPQQRNQAVGSILIIIDDEDSQRTLILCANGGVACYYCLFPCSTFVVIA
jgi:hypothetical protein